MAQTSAAIRTPEVASSPVGPAADGDQQYNAAQRLLIDYYEARGTPPSQRGKHVSPHSLPCQNKQQHQRRSINMIMQRSSEPAAIGASLDVGASSLSFLAHST